MKLYFLKQSGHKRTEREPSIHYLMFCWTSVEITNLNTKLSNCYNEISDFNPDIRVLSHTVRYLTLNIRGVQSN